MYDFECLDRTTNRTFHKIFEDERKARAFAIRCRYGRKILVLSVSCKYGFDSMEDYNYIMGY